MKYTIDHIAAFEILDSRGDPTVKAVVTLSDGQSAAAAVPAGASTGRHEAHELRDGGSRFNGKGVTKAVANVQGEIAKALRGFPIDDQQAVDQKMIELDGTPNKSRLGANAMLSVSFAVSRLAAMVKHRPLYEHLREHFQLPAPARFPRPMCNVLNGGKHADNGVSFQEYLILPAGKTFAEQIERAARVVQTLRTVLHARHERTLVGDEGGFAPMMKTCEDGLALMAESAKQAGLKLGKDVEFGLDAAASEYVTDDGRYRLEPDGVTLSADELVARYEQLAKCYPLRTLEDGLGEDEWAPWTTLTERLGKRLLIIGDDLFVTHRDRLSQGIRAHAANAILIKPNQVGTVTETLETIGTARDDGYACIVSHRSGETCDDFIADLAVAVGAEYLKAGSLTRGERLAKYNRLLAIAGEVGA